MTPINDTRVIVSIAIRYRGIFLIANRIITAAGSNVINNWQSFNTAISKNANILKVNNKTYIGVTSIISLNFVKL